MGGVARLSRGRPGSPRRIVEVPDGDRAQAHERAIPRVLGLCLNEQYSRSIEMYDFVKMENPSNTPRFTLTFTFEIIIWT